MKNHNKKIYIVAGSNGAGKTAFAMKFLPKYAHCPNFINADLIASGLSPFNPRSAAIRAGRMVLEQIDTYAARGESFGFESTLSGLSYVPRLKQLKESGYRITIYYLWIPDYRLANARIKGRVASGGHNIPSKDVKRRFRRSLSNFFNSYQPLADKFTLFDNSGDEPVIIASGNGRKKSVLLPELYNIILKEANNETKR